MNFKLTPPPHLRSILRVGSIFTATLLMVFATTAFKHKEKAKPDIVQGTIINSIGSPDLTQVDFILKNLGSTVGSGTICAGQTQKFNFPTDQILFGPAGSTPFTENITTCSPVPCSGSWTLACTSCAAYTTCTTPSTPSPNLQVRSRLVGTSVVWEFKD